MFIPPCLTRTISSQTRDKTRKDRWMFYDGTGISQPPPMPVSNTYKITKYRTTKPNRFAARAVFGTRNNTADGFLPLSLHLTLSPACFHSGFVTQKRAGRSSEGSAPLPSSYDRRVTLPVTRSLRHCPQN